MPGAKLSAWACLDRYIKQDFQAIQAPPTFTYMFNKEVSWHLQYDLAIDFELVLESTHIPGGWVFAWGAFI